MSFLSSGDQSKSYLNLLVRYSLNGFKANGYQQLTVDNTAKGLTIPDDSKYAILILETDGTGIVARWGMDGNTSASIITPGTGMPANEYFTMDITDYANLDGFRITQESANTTILNIQYFK